MTGPARNDQRRTSHKVGFEEKGQMTERSTDAYRQKLGPTETAICKKCGMFYRDKRWTLDEEESLRLSGESAVTKVLCQACKRMADDNPAGIVTLSGSYLLEHENDILNMIKRTEARSRTKNPLGRIMEIKQEGNLLTISTTEDKLAQKLGREVYKAHKGELHYSWSHDLHFVRVNWKR
jgi:NMD protein affecting ribosome stability and mRNA decay